MQWISYLFTFNIPFYIYKLTTSDAIIEYQGDKQEKSIIILHGAIYLTQIFTNKEALPVAILQKDHIIDTSKYSINPKSYYKITALKKTYLVCFFNTHMNNNNYVSKHFFKYYIKNYRLTLNSYNMMHYVLVQKNTQYRIIQLIILLSIKFGIATPEYIKIPFRIKKRDIAIMTGSNNHTIYKVFRFLEQTQTIVYSKNNFIIIENIFLLNFIYSLN